MRTGRSCRATAKAEQEYEPFHARFSWCGVSFVLKLVVFKLVLLVPVFAHLIVEKIVDPISNRLVVN